MSSLDLKTHEPLIGLEKSPSAVVRRQPRLCSYLGSYRRALVIRRIGRIARYRIAVQEELTRTAARPRAGFAFEAFLISEFFFASSMRKWLQCLPHSFFRSNKPLQPRDSSVLASLRLAIQRCASWIVLPTGSMRGMPVRWSI